MLKINFISTNYIILFELKEYLCIILVFSCSIFILYLYFQSKNPTKACRFFLSTKMKIGSRLLQKSPLLAGNDHVIDIFTSEDMENISLCIFSILLSTI